MRSSIPWKSIPPVVKISGDETFFKSRELQQALKVLTEYHVEEYEGGKHDAILEAVLRESPSAFLVMEKLIVVRDANKVKKPAFVEDYVKNPMTGKVLILLSSDSGKEAKWFKDLKVPASVQYDKIPEWKLSEWLVEESKALGLTLKKEYASAIILNVGDDLYALANEMGKIAVYCHPRSIVEVQDIQDVLYGHSAASPFEIVRLWGMKHRQESLRMLVQHFSKTPETSWIRSSLVMVNSLQDRIDLLIKARSLKDSGADEASIISTLGITAWVYKNRVSDQVPKRTTSQLVDALDALCEVEKRLKLGKPGYLLLQSFISQY
jgi:DNA polymerase III delta subunit